MTKIRRIPLHEPSFDLNDGMALLETLRSTWVSTGGPFVEKFERDFASFVGASHAVSVCNGTIALQLILECLKIERNFTGSFDVIVPTLTFMATAAAVVHAGGHPVFVDCSEEQINLAPASVEEKIREQYSKDPKSGHWIARESGRPLLAVMAAHIMGWPGQADAIADLCEKMEIPYLEDAAESLGTFDQQGKHVGSRSLASAFSFNGNKILTTGGGGMIVTHHESFAKLAKHLSTTAKTDSLRYEHDRVGHNFRMVNILAALGCSQLEKLTERLARKQNVFDTYLRLFRCYPDAVIYQEPSIQGNHWLVNLVFKTEGARETALQKLNKSGIEARPLWTPLHRQKAFQDHEQFLTPLPNAERFWKKMLSLPSSPDIRESDILLISQIIQENY